MRGRTRCRLHGGKSKLTGNTFSTTTVKLLKPDGSQLTSSTSIMANFNLASQTLETTARTLWSSIRRERTLVASTCQ